MPEVRKTSTPGALLIVLTCAVMVGAQTSQSRQTRGQPFARAGAFDSPRIATLQRQVEGDGTGALDRFWAEVQKAGTPLVEAVPTEREYSLVTFLWRGTERTRNVVVVDGVAVAVGGVDPVNSQMTRLAGTDVWYRTYKVRNDARFIYKISENDSMQSFVDPSRKSASVVDPLNAHVFPTGHSYLELPDAPSQDMVLRPSDTPGRVEAARFHSSTLNNDRDLWVYTPYGFDRNAQSYPLLVVLDGRAYTTWVPVPTILDNLIQQRRIRPVVAVMVGSPSRDAELACTTSFANSLANELVPWMRANFNATADPRWTVIGGSSRGGLMSTCAAYQHPTVFGKVLSQSGSYWWGPDAGPSEWLTRQLERSSRLPVQLYLEVGEMEISDQLDTNRRLRDVLTSKGYDVDYREFNSNHTYLNWRGSFADGLRSLIGAP